VLILHGSADKATSRSGSQLFYERPALKDKTLKLYEGHVHDLLNDLGKEAVMGRHQSLDRSAPATRVIDAASRTGTIAKERVMVKPADPRVVAFFCSAPLQTPRVVGRANSQSRNSQSGASLPIASRNRNSGRCEAALPDGGPWSGRRVAARLRRDIRMWRPLMRTLASRFTVMRRTCRALVTPTSRVTASTCPTPRGGCMRSSADWV